MQDSTSSGKDSEAVKVQDGDTVENVDSVDTKEEDDDVEDEGMDDREGVEDANVGGEEEQGEGVEEEGEHVDEQGEGIEDQGDGGGEEGEEGEEDANVGEEEQGDQGEGIEEEGEDVVEQGEGIEDGGEEGEEAQEDSGDQGGELGEEGSQSPPVEYESPDGSVLGDDNESLAEEEAQMKLEFPSRPGTAMSDISTVSKGSIEHDVAFLESLINKYEQHFVQEGDKNKKKERRERRKRKKQQEAQRKAEVAEEKKEEPKKAGGETESESQKEKEGESGIEICLPIEEIQDGSDSESETDSTADSYEVGSYHSPEMSPRIDVFTDTESGGVSRAQLLAILSESYDQEEALLSKNGILQSKALKYLQRAGLEDGKSALGTPSEMSDATDQETVANAFKSTRTLADQLKSIQTYYDSTVEEMKNRLKDKQLKAKEVKKLFSEFKREIARESQNTKSMKSLPMKLVGSFEHQEDRVEATLEKVRLKNITLRKQLAATERSLRKKDEFKNGLHLIDFEQLKIENQTFNEKIEERNEELTKLRRKINNTVHILSHVKEKTEICTRTE